MGGPIRFRVPWPLTVPLKFTYKPLPRSLPGAGFAFGPSVSLWTARALSLPHHLRSPLLLSMDQHPRPPKYSYAFTKLPFFVLRLLQPPVETTGSVRVRGFSSEYWRILITRNDVNEYG